MTKRIVLLVVAAVAAGPLAGCGKSDEGTLEKFGDYTKSIRLAMNRLEREIPRHDNYGMQAAVIKLEDIISGIPVMIEKRGVDRQAERKAAGEEAVKYFREEMQEELLSLRYDDSEILAKLEKLRAIVDRVDNP